MELTGTDSMLFIVTLSVADIDRYLYPKKVHCG